MRIIASSVIRSTNRGESHGGLYVVDTDLQKMKQVLDWNFPDIRWDSGGGDRGLRGLVFYNNYLYAAGALYIYKFNKNFELVDKFTNEFFDGTHEMWVVDDILYSIANQFDTIWRFNLKTEEWIDCFQHVLGQQPKVFKPGEEILRSDSLHLDSVSIKDDVVWYAGSTTEYLYGFNPDTQEFRQESLVFRNTHNARFWKDGIVFNRSLEGETCYQINGQLVHRWPTPRMDRTSIINIIPGDHARPEYTRGMAIDGDMIAIGTSPASIHFLTLNNYIPETSCVITRDIRNTVCGIAIYPWEF